MSLHSWLENVRSVFANRRRSVGAAKHRLHLEPLEARRLMALTTLAEYAVGANPQAIVAADFNNDGQLDLATANVWDDTVSVLLKGADGGFQPAQSWPTGNGPISLAVGDFNVDGNLDLATANAGNYDLSILSGNGDGTFQATNSVNLGCSPRSVAVGDFNGDGKLDLGATSNIYFPGYSDPWYGYWYPGYWQSNVNILFGTGAGLSEPMVTSNDYGFNTALAAADFNADGIDDFVTQNVEAGYATVLLNDSNGYPQGYAYLSTFDYSALATGDVDGDGDIDVVSANRSSGTASVFLNDGDGGFVEGLPYTTGFAPTSVALGDFNLDGMLDIATANSGDNSVSILRGRGDGLFSTAENFAAGSVPDGVAVGDFNNDGWLDAATANACGDSATVLINDHSWPPVPPTVWISDVIITEGNTGTSNAVFELTLTYPSDADVTVHCVTADESATAGNDYVATSEDVIIPAGQTRATFTVAVAGDRTGEPSETFAVNLSSATNATIFDGEGMGTIVDDEPFISIQDVTVSEGNTGTRPAVFNVRLSTAYDAPVTIGFATANGTAASGSDYQAASSILTIPAGQTSGAITVLASGDRLAESNETFFVNLNSVNYGIIADSQGAGTIVDDEPRVSIGDVSQAEGKQARTTIFTFTVMLSAAYDQAVTMSFATVNGTATTANNDYVAKSGMLTFLPGETSKTITIEVKGDNKKEASETFYLDLSGLSMNAVFTKNRGIGTIRNDD